MPGSSKSLGLIVLITHRQKVESDLLLLLGLKILEGWGMLAVTKHKDLNADSVNILGLDVLVGNGVTKSAGE